MSYDPGLELNQFQALTDSSVSQLDIDDLLLELLDRVRDVLGADTAAVMLVDEGSGELEARVARGIEAEVRQGVRVPLGAGFSGRVATTKQSILLDRVDASTVASPILWEKGIKVMLGVPMLIGDDVIGVLHVGRLADRQFVERDVEFLTMVAERAAEGVRARQLAAERAAAYVLERSLMPGQLPAWPGVELAARYVPADRRAVGGDWYDVFSLPSGACWIVVGDVAGHGLEAAVVMGRLRTALRAYSLLDLPPEHVLELVDRKMSHFEIETIATVAVAVMGPPFDSVQIASAGHLPPVVARPGAQPELVELAGGQLLGLGLDRPRTSVNVVLEPDTTVVLYTDGLIERRGESLDLGLERLRNAVTTHHPARVAAEIMHGLVGNRVPDDDVALVVVRRTTEVLDPLARDGTPATD